MKRSHLIVAALLLLLLCRFLYPHTRLGYHKRLVFPYQKHLNVSRAVLKPGESIHLKLEGLQRMAHFSSSDFRIASVTPSGTVHAIRPGTAIIYITQGKKTYRCKITVSSE